MNVPGRTHVNFHPGNSIVDTLGCPLLGEHYGKFKTNERVILNSGKTFKKFMDIMKDYDTFHLTIKEEY